MILLKINEMDFSKYINVSTYKVSRQSVYEEWTDANYRIHRSEYRTRVVGSFDMIFTTDQEYEEFITQVKLSNLITMSVYVGGMTNRLVTSDFYYSIETQKHDEINADRIFNKISVKIEEA